MSYSNDGGINMRLKKSIILSNVLDPYTKNPKNHLETIKRIIESKRYEAIETRLISDEETIDYLNHNKGHVSLEYYVTGDISRANLSLSDGTSDKAIAIVKDALMIASKSNADYLGIASGTNNQNMLKGLDIFINSLKEIFEFIKDNQLKIKLAIEPLDQYAHKKNVIGSLDFTLRMINRLEALGYDENNYIITFDTAHVALNEDDFDESIKKLSKYIYKFHFANAILDKDDSDYGDNHMSFDRGFINESLAQHLLSIVKLNCKHDVEVAVEIREKDINHAWTLENVTYKFLECTFK